MDSHLRGGYSERRARAAPANTPETPTSTLSADTTSIDNLGIDSRPQKGFCALSAPTTAREILFKGEKS